MEENNIYISIALIIAIVAMWGTIYNFMLAVLREWHDPTDE